MENGTFPYTRSKFAFDNCLGCRLRAFASSDTTLKLPDEILIDEGKTRGGGEGVSDRKDSGDTK